MSKKDLNMTVVNKDGYFLQGQFGWTEINQKQMPYLIRGSDKYVSDRIIKFNVFSEYLELFTSEIWDFFPVEKHNMTPSEAQLLNEINILYCSKLFGVNLFTESDAIYLLKDALHAYKFLKISYEKLITRRFSLHQPFGFLRISNTNSVLPYVVIDYKLYVPLFYLDGDHEHLEKNAVTVDGWNLAYLKFTFKIQGIRRNYYDQKVIKVIDFDYVNDLFIPGTKFQVCWNFDKFNSDLLKQTAKNVTSTEGDDRRLRNPDMHIGAYDKPLQTDFAIRSSNNNSARYQPYHKRKIRGPRPVSRYYQIPEVNAEDMLHYFIETKDIGEIYLLPCVNMKPSDPTKLLVPSEEVARVLQVPVRYFKVLIKQIGMNTYRPNSSQAYLLQSACSTGILELIIYDSLVLCLPIIKRIMRSYLYHKLDIEIV